MIVNKIVWFTMTIQIATDYLFILFDLVHAFFFFLLVHMLNWLYLTCRYIYCTPSAAAIYIGDLGKLFKLTSVIEERLVNRFKDLFSAVNGLGWFISRFHGMPFPTSADLKWRLKEYTEHRKIRNVRSIS